MITLDFQGCKNLNFEMIYQSILLALTMLTSLIRPLKKFDIVISQLIDDAREGFNKARIVLP